MVSILAFARKKEMFSFVAVIYAKKIDLFALLT
jgi:hypothetical protein